MATYAIGDLQGCFGALQALLGEVGFRPNRDRLWFVGDLVNRGPDSLATLRFVRSLGAAAVTVLGNHDLSMLLVAEGYGKRHRSDTFDDVLEAPDAAQLLDWLRGQRLFYVEDDWAMVHAGLLPQWSIARAAALAAEVEAALRAPNHRDFLAHMWGSEPDAWREDLSGWARLRVIVNAMTRMRFCTPEGTMEFKAKGPPEQAPAGYLPWFDVPGRASRTHTVLCGHWSALGLRQSPELIALDSGCLWGGELSAVRLEDRRVFQVKCRATKSPDWRAAGAP
jgi:bis(5'-nucleosyl)-tetraphosphatase (symmetrical)